MKEITYRVTVSFAGYIDALEEVEIDAPIDSNEDDLEEILQSDESISDYLFTIDEEDIETLGNGGYEITVNFAGYIGADETYTVYADSLDEAIEEAYAAARADLVVEEIESDEDDEDLEDDDYDSYDNRSEEWYIARDHGEDTDPF